MKRILGLAALLGHALSAATGIQPFTVKPGGRGANKRPVYDAYFRGSRPTDARWWHDVNVPAQANRQMNAQLRRDRRAKKLFNQTSYSADLNRAHYDEFDNLHDRLNPFYIAK